MGTTSRLNSVSVTRPIMFGNFTVPLEDSDRQQDTPLDHTHKWTVFVRDPAGKDDLSYIIKKVVFKLHDTYPQPQRTIESPPFEVTETGWGEFEIQIRIYFEPVANEKQIVLYHHLKLHPYGPEFEGKTLEMLPTGVPKPRPVQSIQYDELVFNEPTEGMFELLVSRPGALLLKHPKGNVLPYSYETENDVISSISDADAVLKQQLEETKEKIKELEKVKKELE